MSVVRGAMPLTLTPTPGVTLLPGQPPGLPAPVGFFVASNGSASNPGTLAAPWTLAFALSGANGAIHPGDTVWMRGGNYTGSFNSTLVGTATQPIKLRAYPGERATINGNFVAAIGSAYGWYWGFEVQDAGAAFNGCESFGNYNKLINIIVHDCQGSGIGFWSNGNGGELYGCISYNNGTHVNLDHGCYAQNTTDLKSILDCVFNNNLTYGVQVFAAGGNVSHFLLRGNISYANGSLDVTGQTRNLFIGGAPAVPDDITLDQNMTWFPLGTMVDKGVELGYDVTVNGSCIATDNYFVGGVNVLYFSHWTTGQVLRNTLVGGTGARIYELTNGGAVVQAGWTFGNNICYSNTGNAWNGNDFATWHAGALGLTDTNPGTVPTVTKVFIRPNAYETGRAHVAIYNWASLGSVPVDLSSFLSVGAIYDVYNMENLFGTPVLSGTYGGGNVNFPMSAVPPATPHNSVPGVPIATGPAFQAFLVKIHGT